MSSAPSKNGPPKTSAFQATRLTPTVFKIVEYDDIYSEHPFIYAKVFAAFILLLDSGCGGASKHTDADVKQLREFLETWPIDDNDAKPINAGGEKSYVVVCSHCHYDHILGLEQFAGDSPILASSHSPSFLAPENRGKHTLCDRLKIPVPNYEPILMPHLSYIMHGGVNTGVQVLHTPGHTPDELALWDAAERMLYVGDTLYEWSAIIFPEEGDLVAWFASVDLLLGTVAHAEAEAAAERARAPVLINAGHDTSAASARDVLREARAFLMDVVTGKEAPKRRGKSPDGVKFVYFARADGRFSLRCPETVLTAGRARVIRAAHEGPDD